MYIGNNPVINVYLDSTVVLAMYLGDYKVFPTNNQGGGDIPISATLPCCFANGYWIDEYPWVDELNWKY